MAARKDRTLEDIVNDIAETYSIGWWSHLNLYLAATGAVPAGAISFKISANAASRKKLLASFEKEAKRVHDDVLYKLHTELGLYASSIGINLHDNFWMGRRMTSAYLKFSVSMDKYDQCRHMYAKNDYDLGRASGFPLPAVLAFGEKVNGRAWNMSYIYSIIDSKIRKDPCVYIYQAYAMWIPEGVDPSTGHFAPSSRDRCVEIMELVRSRNPKLAKIVEKEFMDRYNSKD